MVAQPRAAETGTPYLGARTCNSVLMPGVRKLRDLALASYERGYDGSTARSCAVGSTSEHQEGRAWDWMLDVGNRADRRVAGDFLAWLAEPGRDGEPGLQARRLGVMYAIYNRRIWSIYSADEGWRAYTGASPHTDHIHLSFGWAGARGVTSFWTGQVADTDYGPCVVFADQPGSLTERANPEPCLDPVAPVRRTDRRLDLLGSSSSQVPVARQLLGLKAGASRAVRRRALVRPGAATPFGRDAGGPTCRSRCACRSPTAMDSSAPRPRPPYAPSVHAWPARECAGDRHGVVGSQCLTSITRRLGWLSVKTLNGALRSIASPKDTTPSKSPVKATPRSDASSSCRRLGPV